MKQNHPRVLKDIEPIPISFLLKRILKRSVRYFFIILFIIAAIFISQGIILVKPGQIAVLIKKTGKDLSNYKENGKDYRYLLSCPIIAPSESYKGIQLKVLGEGWHFKNPYVWEYEIHRQTTISAGEVGIKIRLYGKRLSFGGSQILADDGEMGIVREVLTPGRYMINPYAYKVQKTPAITVPKGHRGVVTYRAGTIGDNRFFCAGDIKQPQSFILKLKTKKTPLAKYLFSRMSKEFQKTINIYSANIPARKYRHSLKDELNKIIQGKNIYSKELFEGIPLSHDVRKALKIKVHKEFLITLNRWLIVNAFPYELEKSSFLVPKGHRGVCEETLLPRTYYFNPYEKTVISVNTRSHKFDMSGGNDVKFPSFDGFPIQMEGNIEWRIDPDRVAEVFVKYKDNRDIITCVVEKIIIPNSRAFMRIEGSKYLARDFISGLTREKFQTSFFKGIFHSCKQEGIIIMAARITKCLLPDAICNPIKEREIAIRDSSKYKQEIEREKENIELKKESARRELEIRKVKAQESVEVAKVNALREKEVAVIDMLKQLEVAKKKLKATQNEAEAVIITAKAEADVIKMQNKAKATAIQDARLAFTDGKKYVNYLILQKIGRSLEYILANTDSPFLEVFKKIGKQINPPKDTKKGE